eukprot:3142574-Rhodomonas_salina.2
MSTCQSALLETQPLCRRHTTHRRSSCWRHLLSPCPSAPTVTCITDLLSNHKSIHASVLSYLPLSSLLSRLSSLDSSLADSPRRMSYSSREYSDAADFPVDTDAIAMLESKRDTGSRVMPVC